MRVLMVTSQYPTKARPNNNPAVLNQIRGLQSLGIDIDLYHVQRNGPLGPLVYLLSVGPILSMWRRSRADLIHVQFGGLQALVGALIGQKRSVITYHGTDLHGGTPRSVATHLGARMNVAFSKAASRLCGGVVVVSPTLLGYLPRSVRGRARVLPPGVDYDAFRPEPQAAARESLGVPKEGIRVLFSDISGSPVKRRDTAMAVIDQLQARLPGTQLLLLSSEPYWRVPLFLNAADCLLLTSEKEGSPNIVKEALATDLPIVSVDVGDVAERCAGVANCRIVDRDTSKLAIAVSDVVAIGRSGGAREAKRKEIENGCVCETLRQIYSDVIAADQP